MVTNSPTNLSFILTLVSVIGSYWNLINCRWRTGGNFAKITPFLASCQGKRGKHKWYTHPIDDKPWYVVPLTNTVKKHVLVWTRLGRIRLLARWGFQVSCGQPISEKNIFFSMCCAHLSRSYSKFWKATFQ